MGFIKKHKAFLEQNSLSFFEMTVGMAFDYFSKQKVDVAVIEVGLGGRLDSTNIITPIVSVITNIGLDHTQFLGDTLELIAAEKGGIIKPNIPVVIGETQSETKEVFIRIALNNKSKIVFADQQPIELLPSDLKGNYQSKNIITSIQGIEEVKEQGFKIKKNHIKQGLLHVTKNTGLLGRWQQLREIPRVFCDTGHNKEGLTYVMNQISKEDFNSLHMVFGVVNDKDLNTIVHLLPKTATYYFCKPNIPRGLDAEILKTTMQEYGIKGKAYSSVNKAYEVALSSAKDDDFIFIGGSTFVVAEII
jgi:dihydrofolate synthase/folylpolyglutamate synthase